MALSPEERKERQREAARRYYHRNKEKCKANTKKWRQANSGYDAKWREQNRDKANASAKRWRDNNPERAREVSSRYYNDNKPTAFARVAKRRAIKRDQTPELTPEQKAEIVAIYAERDRISKETGVLHHVDHIIPISKGGLHHPDNLRVITAEENLRKGASLEMDITARD